MALCRCWYIDLVASCENIIKLMEVTQNNSHEKTGHEYTECLQPAWKLQDHRTAFARTDLASDLIRILRE